jgi:dihydrofolate reductase
VAQHRRGRIGRRLFDLTNSWGGRLAIGDAVFVVTISENWPDRDASCAFVTGGLESAIAQANAFAHYRDVSLAAGNLTGQAFAAGLAGGLSVSLVPVVFGSGIGSSATTRPRPCWTTPTSSRETR